MASSDNPDFQEKLDVYIKSFPPEFTTKLMATLDGMSFQKKCDLIKYTPPPPATAAAAAADEQPRAAAGADAAARPQQQPEPPTAGEEEEDDGDAAAAAAAPRTSARKKRRLPPIMPRETKTPRATPASAAASGMLGRRERALQAQHAEQRLRDREAVNAEGLGCIQRARWKKTLEARMPNSHSAFAFTPTMSVRELIRARGDSEPPPPPPLPSSASSY